MSDDYTFDTSVGIEFHDHVTAAQIELGDTVHILARVTNVARSESWRKGGKPHQRLTVTMISID
ncbi:MAG: hypothetical protein J2P28_11890 [Actinobacteria bacterium]|nr:hypothetical protein [Actinomycetota bacterium]